MRKAHRVTFATEFAWRGPATEGEWDRGCFHAIDLPFTFGTLDVAGWREFLQRRQRRRRRRPVRSCTPMRSSRRTASPALRTGGAWPQYETSKRSTVIFDTPCRTVDDPLRSDRRGVGRPLDAGLPGAGAGSQLSG